MQNVYMQLIPRKQNYYYNKYIFHLKHRPASIVDFNMTLLPLMSNIDTDQAVILEEKKFLKRDGNTNSIMVRIVTTLPPRTPG